MLLVVDANILFLALIKDSKTAELLFSDKLALTAPKKIFSEFKKYKTEILSKTHRSDKEFFIIFLLFKDRINTVPKEEIKPFLKKAISISPDPDDKEYFALALNLDCPIWSNDKKLKKQSSIKVFNTEELSEILKS